MEKSVRRPQQCPDKMGYDDSRDGEKLRNGNQEDGEKQMDERDM